MSAVRAVVDRIEGGMAVLLLGDQGCRVVVPQSFLPAGAAEGSVLRVLIELDPTATEDVRRRVQELIDRLREGGEGTR